MTARLDPYAAAPDLMKAWMAVARLAAHGLEPKLVELVKIRASQINGCANCLNMHTAEARLAGETEQRLFLLSAWRDAPCYTDREQAALAWTEAMTCLSDGLPSENVRAALAAEFSEEEQVKLTQMINVINGWNRLSVGFHLWYAPEKVAALRAADR